MDICDDDYDPDTPRIGKLSRIGLSINAVEVPFTRMIFITILCYFKIYTATRDIIKLGSGNSELGLEQKIE